MFDRSIDEALDLELSPAHTGSFVPVNLRRTYARFLAPGYMLSRLFRVKLRAARTRAGLDRKIDPAVWDRRWTVHVQSIGSGEHALLYLARYVYRVALTNHRIERFQHDRVTFRYTHARTGKTRRDTLPVDAFLTRFLQHILPRGFARIRAYGLLSPSRKADLERARRILQHHSAPLTPTEHGNDSPDVSVAHTVRTIPPPPSPLLVHQHYAVPCASTEPSSWSNDSGAHEHHHDPALFHSPVPTALRGA
jgi:hypothetical protein